MQPNPTENGTTRALRADTAALLSQARLVISRYVVLPGEHFYTVIALWVLHTHAISAAETTPRLLLKSPEKESGKTRGLEVLELLVGTPLNTINATVPAIYRRLEEKPSTVLWDEVDAIFSAKAAKDHEDTRALINAGYRRGATVLRMVGVGTKMRSKEFPVFAPMALAAIGDLPDTIESRSIIVPMRRRAPHEHVAQFRRRWALFETQILRDSLAEWASGCVDGLTEAEPEIPDTITDRAADLWEPLLAIAELAGGEWPQQARAAAESIVSSRVAGDLSIGVRLLADIKAVMTERMSSAALVGALNGLEEASWGGWHDGRGMTARDLARRLKAFGIAPKVVRLDGTTPRGYELADLQDAFSRYLRDSSATNATKRNTNLNTEEGSVADVACVAHRGESVANVTFAGVDAQQAQHRNIELSLVADVADIDCLAPEQLDAVYPDAEVVA